MESKFNCTQNPFHQMLNNNLVHNQIQSAQKKNYDEKTVEIDDLFHLLISGCKDENSFLYLCPLDIVAQILENGFSLNEKEGIGQWLEPKNKLQAFCKELFRPTQNNIQQNFPINVINENNFTSVVQKMAYSLTNDDRLTQNHQNYNHLPVQNDTQQSALSKVDINKNLTFHEQLANRRKAIENDLCNDTDDSWSCDG